MRTLKIQDSSYLPHDNQQAPKRHSIRESQIIFAQVFYLEEPLVTQPNQD